jgi:hypothetical protein
MGAFSQVPRVGIANFLVRFPSAVHRQHFGRRGDDWFAGEMRLSQTLSGFAMDN